MDPGYGRKDGKGKKDGGKEGKVRKESKFTIAAREKLVARLEFLALGSRGDMVGRWYLLVLSLFFLVFSLPPSSFLFWGKRE